ncbi:MAG: helix-turn-helix domain-containing protein [Clostridiales Family XIII bacterium]|jgi:transcriptional regulator with XRE-family HTH domain|nr:helix-turn-helix domain-containing protein [Clostridiales Family XIII bacterium]
MAIGERIKRIRNLRKLTQKELGLAIGFDERTADVRIAQYETGTRTPKEKYVDAIAHALDVTPYSLNVPDIDSYIGVMHILFTLEDNYGFKIDERDDTICLTLDRDNFREYLKMTEMLTTWNKEAAKLENGEITQDDYDNWRYNYPKIEAERFKASLDERRAKRKAE